MSSQDTIKKPRSLPVNIVVQVFYTALIMAILAGPITLIVPSYSIVLTRVAPTQVDGVVIRNLLFLIPTVQQRLRNIVEVDSTVTPGSIVHNSTGSSGSSNSRSQDTGQSCAPER